MQFIFAIAAQAADFYLATVKFSFADDAETLVVERSPGSTSIFSAQDREAIIKFEMSDHKIQKAVCSLHRNAQSGRWMIVRSEKILRDHNCLTNIRGLRCQLDLLGRLHPAGLPRAKAHRDGGDSL